MHYFGTFISADGFVTTSAQTDPWEHTRKVEKREDSKQCDKQAQTKSQAGFFYELFSPPARNQQPLKFDHTSNVVQKRDSLDPSCNVYHFRPAPTNM